MSRKINRLFIMTAVGALAALLASPLAWAEETAPIKIGAMMALSGGTGPQGEHAKQAIEAMASIINERGGVLGRKIEIIAKDDEATPAVGVSRANELIADGVSLIIEGQASTVTLATQAAINRADILDITWLSKADAVLSGKGNPLAIRLNTSNALDAATTARYIASGKAKRIAFMTQNDVYGQGAQAGIEAELKRMNYEYDKVAEEKFPFTQTDFRVALSNVRSANPDLVMVINANESVGLPALVRQARQSRVAVPIVVGSGLFVPSVVKIIGDAANGIISSDIYFPEIEPFASNPANKDFVEKCRVMFDRTPDKIMALTAVGLEIWAKAANELKTLDRQKLAQRIRGGSFEDTIFGDVAFEPNGQMRHVLHVFKIENGKPVFIELAQ